MLYALCAAVAWGAGDFLGAVGTRRAGLLGTMCTGQVVACLALALLALTPVPVGRPGPGDLVTLAASGVLGVISYAGFYRALQLGPVSLVSPMFSAYAVVAVILAVVFGGERLTLPGLAGVALTIGGVVLVSAVGPPGAEPQPGSRGRRDGVPYALVAMLSWGVTIYLLGRDVGEPGLVPPRRPVPGRHLRDHPLGHRRGVPAPPRRPPAPGHAGAARDRRVPRRGRVHRVHAGGRRRLGRGDRGGVRVLPADRHRRRRGGVSRAAAGAADPGHGDDPGRPGPCWA